MLRPSLNMRTQYSEVSVGYGGCCITYLSSTVEEKRRKDSLREGDGVGGEARSTELSQK